MQGPARVRVELAGELLGTPIPDHDETIPYPEAATDPEVRDLNSDNVAVCRSGGRNRLGILVEVQRGKDEYKRFSWPAYQVNLRHRIGAPVVLAVVCPTETVASWAAEPIDTGQPGFVSRPLVLGPENHPELTETSGAGAFAEKMALGALVHQRAPEFEPLCTTTLKELSPLPVDRAAPYAEYMLGQLTTGPRAILEALMTSETRTRAGSSPSAKRSGRPGRCSSSSRGAACTSPRTSAAASSSARTPRSSRSASSAAAWPPASPTSWRERPAGPVRVLPTGPAGTILGKMSIERRTARRCARVLLVDEDDRVLLFHSRDYMGPGVEYYVTPGGGLDAGETLEAGAVREVFEETGLRIAAGSLGPVVAETEGTWSDGPDLVVHSRDAYFFLRVPHFEPVRDGLEEVERHEFTAARWLGPAELAAVDRLVFPAAIADLLKGLIGGAEPAAPVRLPWGAWLWDADRDWTPTERAAILDR